ncbi:MAG: ABC transporter ATP-binding protein/permease [Planctomycetes bacterium]|nr:ABC transporter ATP-binding protein/permease [Planctomycetota bacterium]
MTDTAYRLLDPVDRPMRRLFGYLAPFRGRLYAACAASVTNKILDLMPPLLTAWLIDVVAKQPPAFIRAVGGDDPNLQLVAVGVLTVVVFGFESFFQWLYSLGFQRLAQDVQHRLRLDAYRAMQRREIEFFEEHRLGQTLSMLQEDVNQLERFLNSGSGLNAILQVTTTCVFALVVLFFENVQLAAICLAPMPVIIWASFAFSRRLDPRYRAVRQAAGEVTARLENNLAGILVIQSFTAEEQESARLEASSDGYRAANKHAISISAAFIPMIRMAIALGFAAMMVFGGRAVLGGTVSPGVLVVFCLLIQRILWPLTNLGQVFDEYHRASASARRVLSLLNTPTRVPEPTVPKPFPQTGGGVVFDAVDFRYRLGNPVLHGLSFRVAPGETVGIAGPTGSGKTTLVKLLLRLYDTTGGSIRVDGLDVRDAPIRDLRRRIALVSQDVYLFHGTIRENIAYGVRAEGRSDATQADVEAAAKLAHLHDFIASLPQGYDTIVGERGIKLSGGQRQRLSIARAVLKDAPILVLDEATSSVDTETERAIQENMMRLTRGRTALVIAHRLSTIRHAHRIVVLRDGRVTEEGHHDDLVALGGTYADLWNLQCGLLPTGER